MHKNRKKDTAGKAPSHAKPKYEEENEIFAFLLHTSHGKGLMRCEKAVEQHDKPLGIQSNNRTNLAKRTEQAHETKEELTANFLGFGLFGRLALHPLALP